MANATWDSFLDSINSEEKVLPLAKYPVEVTAARPFVRGGVTQRGFFLELTILEGPAKDQYASVLVMVPEPGDRKQGYWYNKKMKGFGDLSAVYKSMPDEDLEGAMQVLCASLIGRKILAEIGPGVGQYSDRNSLNDTDPYLAETVAPQAEAPTPTPAEVTTQEGASEDSASAPAVAADPGF